MADAKAFLTGSMPLRLETNEGLATALMSMEEFGLGLDYIQRYPSIIGAVTAEEILGAVPARYSPGPDRVTAYAVRRRPDCGGTCSGAPGQEEEACPLSR